jgi:hypothetical protein
MTNSTCPKCGADIVKRWTGKSSKLPKWAYRCGSEWNGRQMVHSRPCLEKRIGQLEARIRQLEGQS